MASENDREKELVKAHNLLYRKWKKGKGSCIICGVNEGNTRDHLPPKCLFPRSAEHENPNFLTYRVCEDCNGGTSDSDYLLGVYLAWMLNQDSYKQGKEPDDPDLLALHAEALARLKASDKQDHRFKLLNQYIFYNEEIGALGLNPDHMEVNPTLIKLVKAIYWLQTEGDILQNYNPGWWIYPRIDTSLSSYIESYLKTSNSEIHWGDRYIAHYNCGHVDRGVGGFIMCSLHFYTGGKTGTGVNWHIIAAPRDTIVEGQSLHDFFKDKFGDKNYVERSFGFDK